MLEKSKPAYSDEDEEIIDGEEKIGDVIKAFKQGELVFKKGDLVERDG